MTIEQTQVKPQRLNDRVRKAIEDLPFQFSSNQFYYSSFEPNATFSAITRAATYLRHDPDQALATAPVTLNALQRNDFGSNVLQSMINSSISKPEPNEDVPSFKCTNPAALDACNFAEVYFNRAVNILQDHESDQVVAEIATQNGTPTLLTKRRLMGETTCLTLCDITIDGIPYPAGSITRSFVRPDVVQEAERTRSHGGLIEYDTSAVMSLGFLRPSLFAVPMSQRKLWLRQYYKEERPQVSGVTVGTLNDRIQNVIDQI